MKRIACCTALVLSIAGLLLVATGCPRQASGPTEVAAPPVPSGQDVADVGGEPAAPAGEPSDERSGAPVEEAGASEPSDVRRVSHGEQVELTDYVVKGKTTIFDFYSDGCPPCKVLGPKLEALAESREDIVLVVVDINRPGRSGIDWGSPVARQYNLESIPHLRIFGADGEEQARGDEARAMVEGWLQ